MNNWMQENGYKVWVIPWDSLYGIVLNKYNAKVLDSLAA